MDFYGVYSARLTRTSISAAKTLVQLKSGASNSCVLLRAWIGNTDVETSNQLGVQILRKSAAATVTSFTPLKLDTRFATAGAAGGTSATGVNASAEGTDTDITIDDGFNILNGWLWVPTPEERIVLAPSEIIGLKLADAPAAAVVLSAGFIWGEL